MSSGARAKVLLGVVVAVVLLGGGYYFGVWGYFGLFMGEPNYDDITRYRVMLAAGVIGLALGTYVLVRTLVVAFRAVKSGVAGD